MTDWRTYRCAIGPQVTIMLLFRIPIRVSYVLYINIAFACLARTYFRLAMRLCQLTQPHPSLLLHLLDSLVGIDIKERSFFPAMSPHSEEKINLVSDILRFYSESFTIFPAATLGCTFQREQNITCYF